MTDEDLKSFFARSYPEFFSFAHLLLKDRDSAGNVTAEAFFMLWQKAADLGSEINARAFLFTTIRNHSINFLQYRKKYPAEGTYTYDEQLAAFLPKELFSYLQTIMKNFNPGPGPDA